MRTRRCRASKLVTEKIGLSLKEVSVNTELDVLDLRKKSVKVGSLIITMIRKTYHKIQVSTV